MKHKLKHSNQHTVIKHNRPNSVKRCFVAIPLPERVLTDLTVITDWGKQNNHTVRWVTQQQMHITVVFLGDVPTTAISTLSQRLNDSLKDCSLFSTRLTSAGQFPEFGKPRVLWWGIQGDVTPLQRVATACRNSASELGFLPDKKPFQAHITLGRIRDKSSGWIHWPPPNSVAPASVLFEMNEVLLFESQLGPSGPRYLVLQRFPLLSE